MRNTFMLPFHIANAINTCDKQLSIYRNNSTYKAEGPMQTVLTQIRRRRTRRLICVNTVCHSSSSFVRINM